MASLKTPESPAFMALGLAPSEIQRPTTPTGLATSLANGFAAGGTLALLQNAALEFSPFWLFPHRRLSYEQVLSQPGLAFARNISVSVGTSPKELERTKDDGSIEKINYGRFAVGARTTIWPGTPTKVARQCLAYIKHVLDVSVRERGQAVEAFMSNWQEQPENAEPKVKLPPTPPEELAVTDERKYDELQKQWDLDAAAAFASSPEYTDWQLRKDAAREEFRASFIKEHPLDDPRFERCTSDLHAREGFMAEAAGAYMFSVPKGDASHFKQNALQNSTGWLTAGFVLEDLFTPGVEGSLLGVFRVQRSRGAINDHAERAWLYDVGGRAAAAFARFGLAFEGTARFRNVNPGDGPKELQKLWRMALSVDYRLAGGMWLTGTFGKDFGTNKSTPVLALANFQWNFGLDRGVQTDGKVTQ